MSTYTPWTKIYCDGTGSVAREVREYDGFNAEATLGQCGKCFRILKITPRSGRLRRHSVRGRNTASYDRTMEILWAWAGSEVNKRRARR